MQFFLIYIPFFILLSWFSLGSGEDVCSNNLTVSIISIPSDKKHTPPEIPAEKEEKEEEDRTEEDFEREKNDSDNNAFCPINCGLSSVAYKLDGIISCNSYNVTFQIPKHGARWFKSSRCIRGHQLKISC